MTRVHVHAVRVYYEDVDLAGIVYHANYLRFMERGRSEALRSLGVDQAALRAGGRVFVVTRVATDFVSPARYDDLLRVETQTVRLGAASLDMRQRVLREADEALLARAEVRVACMDLAGRPQRLAPELRARLAP